MKLEDQVCTLESARRLKELGVPQDSLFYWVHVKEPKNPMESKLDYWTIILKPNYPVSSGWYSAFNAGEILQRLPYTIDGNKLRIVRGESQVFHIGYGLPKDSLMDNSLVEGLARMEIMWLENKLGGRFRNENHK